MGSPRSETSILAWCLGGAPEHYPTPGVRLDRKSGDRSRRAQSNWNGARRALGFKCDGHSTGGILRELRPERQLLILNLRKDLESKRGDVSRAGGEGSSAFKRRRSESDSKARWVDGIPLYSFHICGLRKLFPKALFIHIVCIFSAKYLAS